MLQSNYTHLIFALFFASLAVMGQDQNDLHQEFFKNKSIYDSVLRVEVRSKRGAQNTQSAGNGIFVSKEGQLITSHQLVKKAIDYPSSYEVVLTTRGGTEIKNLELGSCDEKLDLCILKANYTLEEPLGFTYLRLDVNEIVGSLQVGHEGNVTFNRGRKSGEAQEKGVKLFVTNIPYTKSSLGLPILNKYGEALGIVTKVKNSSLFAYQSYAVPSKDVARFMKGKFSFTAFEKKQKQLGRKNRNRPSNNSQFSHQKSKYKSKKSDKYSKLKLKQAQAQQKAMQAFQKLLQKYGRATTGTGRGSYNGNRGGKKEKTEADKKGEKVKELLAYKDDVKKLKEERYKQLLEQQNKLMEWEQGSEDYKKVVEARKQEIAALEKLNRRYTMGLAKNKAKLRSENSGLSNEEKELLKKGNSLTAENIKLTDAKIAKLKEELRQAEKKLNGREQGKGKIMRKIGSLKDGINKFDEEMKRYEEEAFDQFGDAI